jgi:hypothetical protein
MWCQLNPKNNKKSENKWVKGLTLGKKFVIIYVYYDNKEEQYVLYNRQLRHLNPQRA